MRIIAILLLGVVFTVQSYTEEPSKENFDALQYFPQIKKLNDELEVHFKIKERNVQRGILGVYYMATQSKDSLYLMQKALEQLFFDLRAEGFERIIVRNAFASMTLRDGGYYELYGEIVFPGDRVPGWGKENDGLSILTNFNVESNRILGTVTVASSLPMNDGAIVLRGTECFLSYAYQAQNSGKVEIKKFKVEKISHSMAKIIFEATLN